MTFSHFSLKQIFKDHWETFESIHEVRDVVKENVEKVLACGDKDKLGYHRYACANCGESHYVAHTCKSRFCNSCGKIMTDAWIDKAEKKFVNMEHYHIVFSPPSELWLLFRSQ